MASTKGSTALAFARQWHHVNAEGRTLGNLASRIAWVLMGKHKPIYDPAIDPGDYVLITNSLSIHLSGKKATDKVYRHHTGYMGGLKEVGIERVRERRGEEILRKAVSRMLPKNTFRDRRLARLRIYPGEIPSDAGGPGAGGAAGRGGGNPWEGNVLRVYGVPERGEAGVGAAVESGKTV